MLSRTAIVLAMVLLAFLVGSLVHLQNRDREAAEDDAPLPVVQSYLQATYAREFGAAYWFMSAADQTARDEASYVQAEGPFTGFALELAKKLAGLMDLRIIEQSIDGSQARIKVAYTVPAPEDLSPLVLGWDVERLNFLPPAEQKRLLERVDGHIKDGKLVTLQGQESFELVREGRAWKIFHDWAAGTRVRIQTDVPEHSKVDVKLSRNEIITKGEEPFQINLKVKNRSSEPVMLIMSHLVEPKGAADGLAMIECGLSRPVTLKPGSEQEFSMAYILSETTRSRVQDFTVTYAFEIKK